MKTNYTYICRISDSMYGGYYGELKSYDGYLIKALLGGYHAERIKDLKALVKSAWPGIEIKFVRV